MSEPVPVPVPEPEDARQVFICNIDGCGKTYTKHSRLIEHQRTHTGERPFVCDYPGCTASYMRATHLAAHARTHMDDSSKPFECPHEGCTKRFWTQQHVRRHVVSCHAMDTGRHQIHVSDAEAVLGADSLAGLYRCESPGCGLVFSKRKYLYAHVREAHSDPASDAAYPFECEHEGCGKRFATNAKRRHHMRIHEEGRYRCILDHTGPVPAGHPPYTVQNDMPGWSFSTWTHLQRHMRLCHPPTCTTCGRAFASRDQLKRHARTHDDTFEFVCPWNGCDKQFRSAYALKVHISRVHHGEKPFVCNVCGQSFGYKHLLQRHNQQVHEAAAEEKEEDAAHPHVTQLLGPRKRARRERILTCPWDELRQRHSPADPSPSCTKKFARLYDVRRHVASVHGVHLSDTELCELVPDADLAQLPEPRTPKRMRTDS